MYFDVVECVVCEVVECYLFDLLDGLVLFNVNILNLLYSEFGGWCVMCLGKWY